ncbi:hypothetical protein M0802_012426 [Mischocyttarus mexicanus]|nr:hypothetical protein M0802_012426 [Mischocyttarus mexicanus]
MYEFFKPIFGNELISTSGTNSTPFLETLFKSFYEGGEYTEQDIRDEMKTLILAGSDTSTNTITFALVMLASYPAIQVRPRVFT